MGGGMRALQEAEQGSHISGAEKMTAWTEKRFQFLSEYLARSAWNIYPRIKRPQLMSSAAWIDVV